jgi:hemoglobin
MTNDISTPADVELLVNTFYDKVKQDALLGPLFYAVIGPDWSHHLPKMYRFWNMVLLTLPGYEGYPTRVHVEMSRNNPLAQAHFDKWLVLWRQTVDSLFSGELADQAKDRAELMANLIHIKVEDAAKGGYIQ